MNKQDYEAGVASILGCTTTTYREKNEKIIEWLWSHKLEIRELKGSTAEFVRFVENKDFKHMTKEKLWVVSLVKTGVFKRLKEVVDGSAS